MYAQALATLIQILIMLSKYRLSYIARMLPIETMRLLNYINAFVSSAFYMYRTAAQTYY